MPTATCGLYAVIPARNEADSIAAVIAAARQVVTRVVVIDDASSDDTARIAAAAGATVLPLALQLGAWGATQAGIRHALACDAQRVVTLDADGQHEPTWIPTLLAPLLADRADVVIGACPTRVSGLRRLAWRYFRALTGLRIEDLTSGFRAYNRTALELLSTPQASLLDYQDVGVLMLIRRHRLRIREIAVPMNPRASGASRVFASWWIVLRYMLATTVLCIANAGTPRDRSDLGASRP